MRLRRMQRLAGGRDVANRLLVVMAVCVACFVDVSWPTEGAAAEWLVSPSEIRLDRPESSQQVLVTEPLAGGRQTDLTRTVQFSLANASVAAIDSQGLLRPLADGTTELVIRHAGVERRVAVSVTGMQSPPPVSFELDVLPVLTKSRCNSGGCHGKAEGQGGFKLSLFGFDADADYAAILRAGRGRRVMLASPERSLILLKGTAQLPHGGGLKLEPEGPGHRRIARWLAAGAPRNMADERPIVAIEVEPARAILARGAAQQLRVTAVDADGRRKCVTAEADYVSNAPHVIEADGRGLLQSTDSAGESAVLVRYQDHVAAARIVVPRGANAITRPSERNFIDRLVWDKLAELGVAPSEIADDASFLRRAYLDTIGTLPTAAEARKFLDDPAPDKRAKLVTELLDRPEYADYWAMKWANLLRADKTKITPQATVGLTRWLRRQFATNRPYDQMVRDILTSQGPIQAESPAALFKALDQPEVAGRSISQLFLGVRIECAQCHHHPSERWGQDDYAGFVGFFTGVGLKRVPGGGESLFVKAGTDIKHPRTGEVVAARPLGAADSDFASVPDRRQVLADWMVGPDNPFFARAIANRIWAHYFGRGLVEPIDDMRATNPATNEPLLAALEAHLKEVRYDLKAFTRTLLDSHVYQLSGRANESNQDDRQHFSHALAKALPAEVLLDGVCQVTGVPEKFNGWPDGVRAIEVWDNRMPSYFFRIFGRPVRATVCECERSNEPSISQALHLLNSPEINAKVGHRNGVARKLADSARSADEIIEELYLAVLTRRPTAVERERLRAAFDEAGVARREAVEDILWSLLNTKEFLYSQ